MNEVFRPRDYFKVGHQKVKIAFVGETFVYKFFGLIEDPPGELSLIWEWLIENQNDCEKTSLKKTGHLKDFIVRDDCEAPCTVSVFWNGNGYCIGVRGEVISLSQESAAAT